MITLKNTPTFLREVVDFLQMLKQVWFQDWGGGQD